MSVGVSVGVSGVCVCVCVCVCVVCTETILNNNSEFYVVLCNKRTLSMGYSR